MPATTTTVSAIMKEVYGPRIENQMQDETVALKRIERTSDGVTETIGGKYVDFPIRVKRNSGRGMRGELEALPNAGNQGYAEVHVPLRYAYGRVKFSSQLMTLAEKNYQAFASAMDNEMNYLKDDLAKDSNRQVYGDGVGTMAVITDTANSADHDVDNAQYLEIGDVVDVITLSSGVVVESELTIEDIVDNTITLSDTANTTADLQGIFRSGNYNREVSGLDLIINDEDELHGLDPANERKWAGIVDTAGANRPLSEGLMIRQVDEARKNGGKTSLILTSLGVRRAYFNLLTQQRRYTDTKNFAGGFVGLAFNHGREIPVIEDPDAPPNTMWGLDEDKFKVYRNKEWHWADEDGNVLKWVSGYDAFEAFMRQFWEIGTSQRNAHWKMDALTEG